MPLKKKNRWLLIALCGVLVALIGPIALFTASNFGGAVLDSALNRRPTISELVGSYKLTVPWGISTLDINPDGSFHQQIAQPNKASHELTGRWHAGNDFNFLAVEFRPFNMVWDDDHERETNIYEINFYKPHFGPTYGVINDDLGESYKRQ